MSEEIQLTDREKRNLRARGYRLEKKLASMPRNEPGRYRLEEKRVEIYNLLNRC